MVEDGSDQATARSPAMIAKLSLLGAGVGLLAGAGAAAFVWLEHELIHLLWHTLPAAIGAHESPWWLTVILPVIGGGLTWAATRLPGHGGHSPLADFGLDVTGLRVVSVVLAALASLAFGAVLGPEAPLLAVGTAIGAAAVGSRQPQAQQVMVLVGAIAAVGAVLGNPLVTIVLLLEIALVGGRQIAVPAILLPCLAGLGSG